jgi:hypothetical protein
MPMIFFALQVTLNALLNCCEPRPEVCDDESLGCIGDDHDPGHPATSTDKTRGSDAVAIPANLFVQEGLGLGFGSCEAGSTRKDADSDATVAVSWAQEVYIKLLVLKRAYSLLEVLPCPGTRNLYPHPATKRNGISKT